MTAFRLPCELDADLILVRTGKGINDAVTVRAAPHWCAAYPDTKVSTSSGCRDGRLHCLQVTHFADENHVRVLPQ